MNKTIPNLIEIQPLTKPIQACITVPGSKSITNRALILAAFSKNKTTLHGALWSEDTQVLCNALIKLGFEISIAPDSDEEANRTITIQGTGGVIPNSGTDENPLELFVGNAGTAARFLTAFLCLGNGVYRLSGTARMHERPQAGLFDALRILGYKIDSPNNKLPAIIHGHGPIKTDTPKSCYVSIKESSQFASALILCAKYANWIVHIIDSDDEQTQYVRMTEELIKKFPEAGGIFDIEPDASSGTYFVAADILQSLLFGRRNLITVNSWPSSGWQIDADFPKYWPLPERISRKTDLGDSIMMAIVLAAFANNPVRFEHLDRLRLQECDRVSALVTELEKCGVKTVVDADSIIVKPAAGAHGAIIETYNDHRIAMCFSILGLALPGIKIQNPACVKKTFPNFYKKLASAPPTGLGISLCIPDSKQILKLSELEID
jgi:3-phosphoshikimate 1-carboxyvinyltransferase